MSIDGAPEDPLPDDWDDGVVELDGGLRIHYTRTGGDGPPLVVAHGVFDDGRCRAPLVRELADEYDVVAVDARGHGRSDAPESGYGPDDRADDVFGVVEALDLVDPVLFGHSMGGDTVLAAAARRPGLPRAVVAVDPACLLDREDEDRDALAEEIRERIRWWHDHSKAELLDADDELRGHVEAGETELASLLAEARLCVSPNVAEVFRAGRLDPAERFPDVVAPTLVLRADVDDETRERDRERVAALPNGRLVHVAGTGHTVFRDDRAAATRALREFLDEV